MKTATIVLGLVSAAFAMPILREEASTALVLPSDPIDCVKEKCPKEYEACEADKKCLPTIEECQKKCGTKESCW
jgi:hypothetical protein